MLRCCARILLLLLLPALAAAQAPPAPTVIDPAIQAHVSAEGLRAVGDALAHILPNEIAATGLSGEIDCDAETPGVLSYASEDIVVHISADRVEITPADGRLDVSIDMTLWSDDAEIDLTGNCLIELEEECTLALQPTALHAELSVALALQDGQLDASVEELLITHGNFGNPVETGCLLGDALATLQGYGVDLIGSVLDQVLDGQISELENQLQGTLDGLAQSLAIQQELEVMGATLIVDVTATELQISPSGLLLGFRASFGTEAYGACVPHGGAYQLTAHDLPPMTGLIPGTAVPYHVGIVVHGDMLNQALYAAWQGGLLCLRVADLVDLAITTDYLGLIDEDLVDSLWPEAIPLDLYVSSAEAPRIRMDSIPRLDAELALDVYGAELDRQARLWRNGLVADAGIDLALEVGVLSVDLDFDLQTDLGVTVAYNEWLPSELPAGFGSLVPDLVGQAVDVQSMLPTFAIPAFNGLTLSALDLRAVGDPQDHLGVFGWVDPTVVTPMLIGPIELTGVGCGDTGGGGDIVIPGCEDGLAGCSGTDSGCGGDGGCGGCGGDASSCGTGGCGVARSQSARWLLVVVIPAVLLRRRRR